MIKRYEPVMIDEYEYDPMEEKPDGEFVTFEDHQQIVENLQHKPLARGETKMNLTIKPIDADNAKGYYDMTNCLVSTAAKRQFKTEKVSCDRTHITINGHDYRLSQNLADFASDWPGDLVLSSEKQEAAAVRQQLPQTFELEEVK